MPGWSETSHFAPHEGHISHITHGASGRCFASPGLPSRTQKCDEYCHIFMRHPTISRHHPSMPFLTSCRDAHTGWPYLAVLVAVLGLHTRHRAGQYCTTEIRTVSRHLFPITTFRAKIKKIAKCHILYTPNYPILPYLSASFTLAPTLHIDTN